MFKILVNKCKDIWNQNSNRNKKLLDLNESQDIPDIEREDYSFVNEALNKLPEEYKEVTILHYYDGFSVKEISKILDINIKSIDNSIQRIRRKFKKLSKAS